MPRLSRSSHGSDRARACTDGHWIMRDSCSDVNANHRSAFGIRTTGGLVSGAATICRTSLMRPGIQPPYASGIARPAPTHRLAYEGAPPPPCRLPSGVSGFSVPAPNSGGQPQPPLVPPSSPAVVSPAVAASPTVARATSSRAAPASVLAPRPASPAASWAAPPSAPPPSLAPYYGGQVLCKLPKSC
jgi:hypothetical protein